jgi:TrmH family RNA methyltransferase
MTQIQSHHNPKLKALRKLQTKRGRATSGQFLVEGEDLVQAAAEAGREPVAGYRLTGSGLGGSSFHDVERSALHEVSALGSGARVIGVYEQRWGDASGPLCVYLHGVSDPGNVGTVLRSALAFGASSVALGPGCADPHSPKAVRASMGAIFSVQIARTTGLEQLSGELVALVAGRGQPLAALQSEPLTLLIGSERAGLPEQVIEQCQRVCHIPILSESLNAAMAATVALYELSRKSETPRAT